MEEIHKLNDTTEKLKKLKTIRRTIRTQLTNVKKWIDSVLNLVRILRQIKH
jgi:DNA-binding FrmR family transcriptional regulator